MQDLTTTAQEAAVRTPQERDKAAAEWFERHCGLRLEERQAGELNPNLTRLVFVSISDRPNTDLAMKRVRLMLTPAPETELEQALATLSLLVAKREGGDDVEELQMRAYVAELRRYPEDIALHAVSSWHRRSKFWPTWFELQEQCEALFANRRGLMAALQRIETKAAPKIEKSDADIAEVRAMAAAFAQRMKALPQSS